MYGYYREKLHVNHFWELKGLLLSSLCISGGGTKVEISHSNAFVNLTNKLKRNCMKEYSTGKKKASMSTPIDQ